MDRVIRGANWYCGEINQRLRADETTLPQLSREMAVHVMGGGIAAMELPAEIKALSSEMTLTGNHEDIRSRFGREPGDWTTVYYYESLLNVFANSGNGGAAPEGQPRLNGRVVIMQGLLNDITQPGVKGQKASAPTRLRWSSIVLYHDVVNGRTVHKLDIQRNTLIIDGVNYTAEHNRLIAA